eukprot:6179681-Pleurochrysis_carterae.AAC.1
MSACVDFASKASLACSPSLPGCQFQLKFQEGCRAAGGFVRVLSNFGATQSDCHKNSASLNVAMHCTRGGAARSTASSLAVACGALELRTAGAASWHYCKAFSGFASSIIQWPRACATGRMNARCIGVTYGSWVNSWRSSDS